MKSQKSNKSKERDLLNKYLSGTASENEISQLREFSESSVILKEKLKESDKVVKQIGTLQLMKKIDTPSAFLKTKERLKKYPDKNGWLYYWQKIAAILLLPLLLFSISQFFVHPDKTESFRETAYNEINTSPGLRSTFRLPDGTKVWLNGRTKIRYPITFTDNERRVHLEGEAYFEVAKDKKKPFIIDLGTLHVQAVGTAFNCMAYPEDNLIETALNEGVVKIIENLNGKEEREYLLKPGQVLTYQLNSDQFYLKEGVLDKHLAWRSGKFMFRNDPLEVVCQKLGRWFNAEITIKDESLKSYAFTGTFQEEDLNEILELISLTSPIRYNLIKREANEKGEYATLKVIIMKK